VSSSPYRWIASFDDPVEAERCVLEHAKRIKRLGVAWQFSVGIRTEQNKHHVHLFKREDEK
jgi:hypothetical protein